MYQYIHTQATNKKQTNTMWKSSNTVHGYILLSFIIVTLRYICFYSNFPLVKIVQN